MDNQMYRANMDMDNYDEKMQLLEKGRQLHNQAIREMFATAARGLARSLSIGGVGSSKDRGFEYMHGEMPATK